MFLQAEWTALDMVVSIGWGVNSPELSEETTQETWESPIWTRNHKGILVIMDVDLVDKPKY